MISAKLLQASLFLVWLLMSAPGSQAFEKKAVAAAHNSTRVHLRQVEYVGDAAHNFGRVQITIQLSEDETKIIGVSFSSAFGTTRLDEKHFRDFAYPAIIETSVATETWDRGKTVCNILVPFGADPKVRAEQEIWIQFFSDRTFKVYRAGPVEPPKNK